MLVNSAGVEFRKGFIEVQEKKTKIVFLHPRHPQKMKIYTQFHVEEMYRDKYICMCKVVVLLI